MAKVDAKARQEKMKIKLGLNDEQSAKMASIHKESMEKLKSIRENQSLTQQQRKEQAKKLQEDNKEKMKSFLTAEQLKKLDEMKSHRGKMSR